MKSTERFHPPKWADKLLERFCKREHLEEIQGDLHESFYWRLEEKGEKYAKWKFIKETLLSFRTSNLKSLKFMDQILTLLKSHIKTGWRFLWKTKGYSSINIIGLSVGIVFSWFAYIYAKDQLGYNKHLNNVDDLYRVSMQVDLFGNLINFPGCSHATTDQIVNEIPEVLEVARFTDDHAMMKLGKSTIDQDFLIAEKSLLNYLNLEFVEGEPGEFSAPNQVVISESLAYKLGIRGRALDGNIQLLDSATYISYQIKGVYKDIPKNTSIKTNLILPYSNYLNESPKNAIDKNTFDLSTILKLSKDANPEIVNAKINEIIKVEDSPNQYIASLQSMANLHLSDNYFANKGFLPGGNSQLIWFIVIAGILCLSISIINYANFSISLYLNRAREVAVRKIMGSANSGVFQQLMTESFLTTILATFISFGLFALIAPQFSLLVEKKFTLTDLFTIEFVPGLIVISIIIAMLSGLYPSILLSRFQILKSLKGVQRIGKGKYVTQTLLIVQFSMSIIMMACMIAFNGQLKYMLSFDRGYNVDNVLRVSLPIELNGEIDQVLFNKINQIPEVSHMSSSNGYSMLGYDDGEHKFSLLYSNIDSSFINLMGISLIQGETLKQAKNNGISNGILVNESFLEKFPDLENPIGYVIPFNPTDQKSSVIVGVIKDFYSLGPKADVKPLAFYSEDSKRSTFNILIKTTTDRFTIEEKLAKAWDDVYAPIPFSYEYLSVEYNKKFDQEAKIAQVAGTGSIIAIFIASFGLLGLVGLTIQRKLKEVSVRRVLGAGIENISAMLFRNFLAPITISLIVGLPTGAYIATEWLANYKNRIELGWQEFTLPALVVISILTIIIFTQVIRVTKKNPIIYLKDD